MYTVLNTPMKTVNKCAKIVLHVLVYLLAKYCRTCIFDQNHVPIITVHCSADKVPLNLVLALMPQPCNQTTLPGQMCKINKAHEKC